MSQTMTILTALGVVVALVFILAFVLPLAIELASLVERKLRKM